MEQEEERRRSINAEAPWIKKQQFLTGPPLPRPTTAPLLPSLHQCSSSYDTEDDLLRKEEGGKSQRNRSCAHEKLWLVGWKSSVKAHCWEGSEKVSAALVLPVPAHPPRHPSRVETFDHLFRFGRCRRTFGAETTTKAKCLGSSMPWVSVDG